MIDFWLKSKNKGLIYALAPMAGITNSPFRQICKDFGADVVYSEMASVAALVYSPDKTLEMLRSTKVEDPYVIQLFGSNPAHFEKATKLLTKFRNPLSNFRFPAGLDINFGCPVAKVLKQGAGAALFADLKKSRQVIQAVVENTDLPVSIKTRVRTDKVSVLDFLAKMSDLPLAAIMIHGRSLKQGFKGPLETETIRQAKKYFSGVVLANGGVKDIISAKTLLQESSADGLGIGQGALGRPWIFQELKTQSLNVKTKMQHPKTFQEIQEVILRHAKLVKEYNNNFREFRSHLLWYVSGLEDAKKLKGELVGVDSLRDLKKVLKIFNFSLR